MSSRLVAPGYKPVECNLCLCELSFYGSDNLNRIVATTILSFL